MKKEQIIASIPDYLDGKLDENQKKIIREHLQNNKALSNELKEYELLLNAFDNEQPVKPSKKLEKNFLQLLEEEKNNMVKVVSIDAAKTTNTKNWFSGLMKVAASIALLIAAFTSGRYFQSEKSNVTIASIENESLRLKQTTMISLMENQSASKRIKGVQYIQDFENPDEAIVNALTNRMLYDKNTNVRLTAVEVLSRFTNSQSVKTAFITALGTEKDPSVQIAIIQNLVKTQEKKAVEPMKKLLEQEDTQPFVKDEINQVLSEII
ncbi:HEAT repeat domain-containing protein [Croceitalea rosinachiae]|uniref:HEAT repeat domain-containing protein n=1 Tax=Croceitalea rosinachiae TaxID=3075596 RepID=A0ABU3A734_9FLAO|nr:HEAT repeat domain-containing protein [Croceitalea sp. F388]MDT0605980.1 HEAT repeat domain-containing protein [Croceitalea sp. F388]